MHFGVDLIQVDTILLMVRAIAVSEQQMILSCVGTVKNLYPSKAAVMHQVTRVYSNGDRTLLDFNTVQAMDLHLGYSVSARFGCAHFRDGKCVSVGYIGEDRCKEIEAELLSGAKSE